jgi:hypothetical protein
VTAASSLSGEIYFQGKLLPLLHVIRHFSHADYKWRHLWYGRITDIFVNYSLNLSSGTFEPLDDSLAKFQLEVCTTQYGIFTDKHGICALLDELVSFVTTSGCLSEKFPV